MKKPKKTKLKKADDWKMSHKYLAVRKPKNPEFKTPKWITFTEDLLNMGLVVYLYEAKTTFSKYITVHYKDQEYKVRFSNHKPNKTRESQENCDFFVGVNNHSVTTTEQAMEAFLTWKGKIDQVPYVSPVVKAKEVEIKKEESLVKNVVEVPSSPPQKQKEMSRDQIIALLVAALGSAIVIKWLFF